jgi:hypothetical protein
VFRLDYAFPEEYSPEDIFVSKDDYYPNISPFIVPREDVEENFETELVRSLSKVISRYNFRDIVFLLSKIHFYKNVPISSCYDLLIEIARASGDTAIYEKAKLLRKFLIEKRELGERFSMAQWPSPLKAKK